jgi:uncharacterized protein DUF4277/DDE family transposase
MYIKRHAVVRGEKRYVYLRLVQAYRDQHGRVRHRVLRTLGREDELKASGQLEQLMGSFARLDPPMAGVRREVGPLLLAAHFVGELDVVGTIDRALPQRGRQQLSAGEVAAALICSRLCSPSPLYDIAGWASGSALQELLGIPPALLNDDRLGRGLEALAVYAETLRGALAARAIERFGIDAGRLHVDLTTLRVAGAYEDSALVAKGWGPDRRVERQVRALQATTACGVSLYVRPDPGNAAEVALIGASLERLKALAGRSPGLLICDAACGYPKTLCEIARSGLRFVVPLRVSTGFRERYLTDVGDGALRPLGYVATRQKELPARLRTRYRGVLRDWEITDPETGDPLKLRVAYIHSSEQAREVGAARERALTKAEGALARVQRGLGGRYYKTRRQVDARVAKILTGPVENLISVKTATRAGRPTLAFSRDPDAITAAARTDGIYALATNLPGRLNANRVLEHYKGQQIVERRHRDYKQTLNVRPIFLHNDDRIYALTSIVGLALLIFGLIESQTRKALGENHDAQLPGLLPEGRAAKPTGRNILAAFQGLGLTHTPNGIRLDRLTHTQRQILELLKIQPPWPEQEDHALTNRGKCG